MDYVCPVCKKRIPRELRHIVPHTEEHIIGELKRLHPDWADKDGICHRCLEHYKKEIKNRWSGKKHNNDAG